MKTVLLGTDFLYNKVGDIVPIEVNTNIDWHPFVIEEYNQIFDLTGLSTFITNNSITKIIYIGNIRQLMTEFKTLTDTLGITFESLTTSENSITIPYVEDNDQTLIIRSSYDTTALVDDSYCRDKVGFMNLIKDSAFGSQFAYKENTTIVNHITTINDNGVHPNFIIKRILPQYDTEIYPKFIKVSTQSELDTVLANMDSSDFIMEFHLNLDNLYENHIKTYRGFNILFPPNLESISLGGYTFIPSGELNDSVEYNPSTFELYNSYRNSYTTTILPFKTPKLLDTDKVEMADGSFKTALELQVGDDVKTIDIPNPNNIDLSNEAGNFDIDYNTFLSGSTYSTNKVLAKSKVSSLCEYIRIDFTDDTYWEDTAGSYYLVVRDNEVRFVALTYRTDENTPQHPAEINIGDNIILIDTTNSSVVTPILKEVKSVTVTKQIFTGWEITVQRAHIFLTQTNNNTSFAAIEHNVACGYTGSPLCAQYMSCQKGQKCVKPNGYACAGFNSCNCSTYCSPAY